MPALPGRAATTRIAWISDSRASVRLLRAPLLAELTVLGHKVLVMAPDLTEADRLALLAEGIESDVVQPPQARIGYFSDLSARRNLMRQLQAWSARIVVADGADVLSFAVAAARQAGISHICPVAPALEGAENLRAALSGLRGQNPAFASTQEGVRWITAEIAKSGGISPTLLPLARLPEVHAASPLPGLDAGFIFCGVTGVEPGPFAAAVHRLTHQTGFHGEARVGRARFQVLVVGSDTQSAGGPLEKIDASDEWSGSALRDAHVVVVDGHTARHQWALAQALMLGRPVLAIDAALTRDLIDSGASGWLVPRDAGALAAALTATLKRPDLLPGMAQAARRKAERRFDRGVVREALLDGLGLGVVAPAALHAGKSSA
jgi:hypothetical protein